MLLLLLVVLLVFVVVSSVVCEAGAPIMEGSWRFLRGRHGWINVDETQGFFGKDIDAEEIVWPSNLFFFILTFI